MEKNRRRERKRERQREEEGKRERESVVNGEQRGVSEWFQTPFCPYRLPQLWRKNREKTRNITLQYHYYKNS